MNDAVIAKLSAGWYRYQRAHHAPRERLYANLAERQTPKILFITCADSRIEPAVMFQSEPGELFIARNPGNIVPPYGVMLGGASASLEYGLTALSVSDIIVCGHSSCGAMKGLLYPKALTKMPLVSGWLRFAEAARSAQGPIRRSMPIAKRLASLAEKNVVVQLDHLRTYPIVVAKLSRQQVRLHAWYYDIPTGGITCFHPDSGTFRPLSENTPPAYEGKIRLVKARRK